MSADDRGESLIEVLMAVVIMGVAIAAVVGGLVASVLMSDVHRKQTTAGAAVHNYAEAIQNYVLNGSDAANGNFAQCSSVATADTPTTVGFTVPTGFTASISAPLDWNGSAWVACGANQGLEQFTVQIASSDARAAQKLTIEVRRPCRLGGTLC